MVFRFLVAIGLVVLVALAGVALEKRALELRREVSRQHFRESVLLEQQARLRLRTQEHGAPAKLIDALEDGRLVLEPLDTTGEDAPAAPILFVEPAASTNERER